MRDGPDSHFAQHKPGGDAGKATDCERSQPRRQEGQTGRDSKACEDKEKQSSLDRERDERGGDRQCPGLKNVSDIVSL